MVYLDMVNANGIFQKVFEYLAFGVGLVPCKSCNHSEDQGIHGNKNQGETDP